MIMISCSRSHLLEFSSIHSILFDSIWYYLTCRYHWFFCAAAVNFMRWTSPHSCLTAISQFHSAQRGKIGGLVWTTLLHTRSTTKRKFVLRFKMILHFITTSPLTPAQELLLSAQFGKKIKLYLRWKSCFLTVMYMIRQYCITSHWSELY